MPGRILLAVPAALVLVACTASSSAGAPVPSATAATVVAPPPTTALTPSTAGTPSTTTAAAATAPCGVRSHTTYRHVVWIWMENRGYRSVLGRSGAAPRLAGYARRCGVATDYHAVSHPSLPNYIAATRGGTAGIRTDCPPASCSVGRSSIFGQVRGAGLTWRGYAESMGKRCNHVSFGRYAARHNPAVYYRAVAGRCRHWDVPLGGRAGPFASALRADRLPSFAFVTPNLCHDGHDCSTATADGWLGRHLDRITASRAYRAGHTVVFVTWDENEGGAGNRVATVVIGPTVPPGTRSGRHFTHYSLLRTAESLLGLPALRKARRAADMRSAFHLG